MIFWILIFLVSLLPTIIIIILLVRFFKNMYSGSAKTFNNYSNPMNLFSQDMDFEMNILNNIWNLERQYQQYYNYQMEQLLQQIAFGLQSANPSQARSLTNKMEHDIQKLPPVEKKVYEAKLNDVMHGRKKLNENMMWVDA